MWHRLAQIILYGSQARGDARPDSDIDVLIVLREPLSCENPLILSQKLNVPMNFFPIYV
ncbi:MAG: nucleotidyltransferase domain-containing protein [Cyanobacteria bacterium CRU_2_1]|nr:nucleotidyltransferase domain-containing protein [Cyanobacteria bacterium RU_5_0]NJR62280.1 nucleotidyltransferase domain-containing protein [Cyanobacteria bacterium CRU_2_1]